MSSFPVCVLGTSNPAPELITLGSSNGCNTACVLSYKPGTVMPMYANRCTDSRFLQQSLRSPCLAGLATNLLKLVQQNNGTMHVHNRTAAKADPLVKQGATWASSPASIGRQCSITFSCVFSDTALKEVFTAYLSGHPKQDSLYIDCSTVSPDTIRELDAKAKAAGDPTQVTMTQDPPHAATKFSAAKLVCGILCLTALVVAVHSITAFQRICACLVFLPESSDYFCISLNQVFLS